MTTYEIDESRTHVPHTGVMVRISPDQSADISQLTRKSLIKWVRIGESTDPGFAASMIAMMMGHQEPECSDGGTTMRIAKSVTALKDDRVFMALVAAVMEHGLELLRMSGEEEFSHDALLTMLGLVGRGCEGTPWLEEFFRDEADKVIAKMKDGDSE